MVKIDKQFGLTLRLSCEGGGKHLSPAVGNIDTHVRMWPSGTAVGNIDTQVQLQRSSSGEH